MYSFDEKCKLYLAENFRDSKAHYIVPSCGGVILGLYDSMPQIKVC